MCLSFIFRHESLFVVLTEGEICWSVGTYVLSFLMTGDEDLVIGAFLWLKVRIKFWIK